MQIYLILKIELQGYFFGVLGFYFIDHQSDVYRFRNLNSDVKNA